jgi:hypothetical protein
MARKRRMAWRARTVHHGTSRARPLPRPRPRPLRSPPSPPQYKHSKWRGHQLRVEVAQPTFRLRLQEEQAQPDKPPPLSTKAWRNLRRRAYAVVNLIRSGDDEETAKAKVAAAQQPWPPRPADTSRPLYVPLPGRKSKASCPSVRILASPAHRAPPPPPPHPLAPRPSPPSPRAPTLAA